MYKEVKNEHLGDTITSLSWSPDGNLVAVGTLDERIILK